MILDRDEELAILDSLVEDLGRSGGRTVLVRGEAGIGKSALVAEFVSRRGGGAHILLGGCDDLLTPQPFSPFWDIAREEPSLATPLNAGDRRGVLEALIGLLSRSLRPTILVLEDTQWADEATLDIVKYIGRRIGRTNGLLILTYRDVAVDQDHPLRQVVGDIPPDVLVRLQLDSLSLAAIETMIAGESLDVAEVFALTSGNPLFVAEIARLGTAEVPSSVRESVLARVSRVSPAAREILHLAAVVPGDVELELVEEILAPGSPEMIECSREGLLQYDDDRLSYRHELQRRAVEASLPDGRRRSLNQRVLDALDNAADPSRLVHHAREAEDVGAIVRFAPAAARAAMAIGGHREGAAHFRTLEPHLSRIERQERADILDNWARAEFYLDSDSALEVAKRAVALHRSLGDTLALARSLTFAVRVNEMTGHPVDARGCSIEAIAMLESTSHTLELAAALSQRAWLEWVGGDDTDEALAFADRAIALAALTKTEQPIVRAMIIKGAVLFSRGDQQGFALVEESHKRAVRSALRFEEVYALVNMAGLSADIRDIDRASVFAQQAIEAAARYEIRPLEAYARAIYAEILFWRGDWAAAEDASADVLASQSHVALVGWRVLGIMQARRGSSEALSTLRRMWAIAAESDELQNLDPAASALGEYMWLSESDDPAVMERMQDVFDQGLERGVPWPSGALAFWLWKLDRLDRVPPDLSGFYRWILEGDWKQAAGFWESRGVPYEQALALMHGDADAQVRSVRIFEELGAVAAANRVRGILHERGMKVPRGKARSTRTHFAGLTARQAEVLDLLAEDLSNAEIADRLFISNRTAENHVAAVLMKLDVPTRAAAVDEARSQGLLESL